MKLQKHFAVLLVVSLAMFLGGSPRAFAGPDAPVIDGSLAYFTGNQSNGIASGSGGVSTPPVTDFWIYSLTRDITPATGVPGVKLFSQAANGSNGGVGVEWFRGGSGGTGAAGPDLSLIFQGDNDAVRTSGLNAYGIGVQNIGGRGGNGGGAGGLTTAFGGHGGRGGNGGMAWIWSDAGYDFLGGGVVLFPSSLIQTTGGSAPGIYAVSRAGDGGSGGDAGAVGYGEGGNGGVGGTGGSPLVLSNTRVTTAGASSDGISANSLGGSGGSAGAGGALFGQGGGALGSGPGGPVSVANYGTITTTGADSRGIFAQSVGGFAGSAGGGGGLVGWGGSGDSAGDGDSVAVASNGAITTAGDRAHSILAQSVGGGGGSAGATGGLVSLGGSGSSGGNGDTVEVRNTGRLQTTGSSARGIYAQSIGGGGGDGGASGGIVSLGGDASSSGNGGNVSVTNSGTITTGAAGERSHAILAQSVGGGGGNAGDSGGALSFGASGSAGGQGGGVTVTNNGQLQTLGTGALGILAQSVGGGGGDGGTSGGALSFGGSSSRGSDGGNVTVTNQNAGAITTAGENSHAILAQSVGGGGGSAGNSAGALSFGGTGSGGGSGASVTVTNSAQLGTTGEQSRGIFAQSVGGGGGAGGNSAGLITLGGSGSGAGHGGAVNVLNSGRIQTLGGASQGLFAQSVGGGGGTGGDSAGGFAFGGSGNKTGNGGTVAVDNDGSITTSGDGSASIFAQSTGGGGGFGAGYGGTSYSPLLSMGGRGGAGGNGGVVTVNNSGPLETSGIDASGIFAQSIGGGGGAGGEAKDFALGIAMTIGGSSTRGGQGGWVDVDSGATSITTAGAFSHGIRAMSVGGGGGSGGDVASYAGGLGFTGNVAIGGQGGGGGNGGPVDLTSASQVTTHGEHAHGLYAESVGGGGGSGGSATTWTVGSFIPGVDLPTLTFGMSLGGKAGQGGNGLAVTVNNTGAISTSASHSYGTLAQSIGGGGGHGGNSMAGMIAVNSWSFTTSVGGEGGNGGSGGLVQVDSAGSTTTQGDFAYGILAQSVGGGGGAGGNSKTFLVDIGIMTSPADLLEPSITSTMSLGGKGGGGGSGGRVDVVGSGPINTQGEFAHGILAQSVGGGGGVAGDTTNVTIEGSTNPQDYLPFAGFLNVDAKLLLGGSGGSGGHGGLVHVANSDNITTRGDFANGILAQSVGGGGGAAGYVRNDVYCPTSPTAPTVLQLVGGGGGSGGDVTVENSADIVTHGGFAHGILAQSVGGGGGFAGISEEGGLSYLVGPLTYGVSMPDTGSGVGFAGSAGGSGSAGAVTVTHTGSITTHGDMSHGILAQSAAASGTAGPVTVTLHSEITTNGENSDGIHAQSAGGAGNGNITITNGGTIRGGSGAGAGVNIDGGANNTLTNAGGGSISALSGKAIVGGNGNDTIINYGTVAGAVELGGGINAFHNNPGARFDAGMTIDLGAGNTLSNAGILSPGGLATLLRTTLIGDLSQSPSGILEIELGGFETGLCDFLDIKGTLTGELDPSALPLPTGKINFSFLPGYDIVADIAPGESWTLQFLRADYIVDGFASMMSYDFFGGPLGFQYNVFRLDDGLYLQASNVVPTPGAFLLGFIGLGVAGWRLRRPVPESARVSKVAESL